MRKNPFRKYRGFIKGSLLNLFAFRFEVWGWVFQGILTLCATFFLWFAIFKEKGGMDATVNGYTFMQMIYYLSIGTLTNLWTANSMSFDTVSDDIREGNIAVSLTKPISYRSKSLCMTLGNSLGNFLVFFLPLFIIVFLVFTLGFGISLPQWYNVIFYFIAGLLAIIINDSFDFLIAQLGFLTNSLFGIMVIKSSIISFLSGGMIPFSFFPEWAQSILTYLPFSGLFSTPSNIFLGTYSIGTALFKIGLSLGWAVVLYSLSCFANSRMIKHVVGAGG